MSNWYRSGLIGLVNGSKTVTGTGTAWLDNVAESNGLKTPAGVEEIESVTSNTALQLVEPYAGPTVNNVKYAIIPTQGVAVSLVNRVVALLSASGAVKDAYASGQLAKALDLAAKVDASSLSATGGSSLLGYDGGTMQDVADYAKSMQSYTALRAYTGRARSVRITSAGIAGIFERDPGDTTSADNGGTTIVDAAARRWKRVWSGVLDVQWFGADPRGFDDSTVAWRAAGAVVQAASGKTDVVAKGRFKVTVLQGESLIALTNASHVKIDASAAVIDNSGVSYTADALTPIFLLNGGENFDVRVGQYIGFTLPTPLQHHGYRGATLLRAINGAKKVRLNASATNLRYGLQTGEYGDATKGNCSDFEVVIRGSMIGYPIAAYLAEDIVYDIDVDGVHRAAYIAGCDTVRGVARWRDQYVADTVTLLTDALASGTDAAAQADPVGAATTSRGCSNIDIESIDKGSTIFQASTSCAGITMSRVDPCVFKNIRIRVSSKGTDTISTRVGGFRIVSGAKSVQTRYPLNWRPEIVFDNVAVSGVIDHSQCTLPGNSGSEFYVYAFDATVADAASFLNFSADDFVFKPSSGQNRPNYFYAPGLKNSASFRGYHTPGCGLAILTNSTVETVFERGQISSIDVSGVSGGSKITIGVGSVIGSQTSNTMINNTLMHGGSIGGAGASLRQRVIKFPGLAGASVSVANAFQAGEVVVGVQGIIKTTIPGPTTGIQVGTPSLPARYANQNILAAGIKFTNTAAATDADRAPHTYVSSSALVITPRGADFTGGEVWVSITYYKLTDPVL